MLDFGIAKIVEDEGTPELTGAGDLVGTPAYMSPEQIRGGFERDAGPQEIDGRSDLYSTGVVLYHLLTGTLPFRGSKMALLAAHLNNAPLPMKEANPRPTSPPQVERVVMQCLEKDPADVPRPLASSPRSSGRPPAWAVQLSALPPARPDREGPPPRSPRSCCSLVIGLGAVMLARGGADGVEQLPQGHGRSDRDRRKTRQGDRFGRSHSRTAPALGAQGLRGRRP